MTLTKKDIEHISRLARIKLSENEKEKYTEELSAILNFIDKLKELDTTNVEPLYQVTGLVNITRKDKDPLGVEQSKINKMISQASQSENNFIKVKAILDKS